MNRLAWWFERLDDVRLIKVECYLNQGGLQKGLRSDRLWMTVTGGHSPITGVVILLQSPLLLQTCKLWQRQPFYTNQQVTAAGDNHPFLLQFHFLVIRVAILAG